MIEELLKDIFVISIPIPKSPLKNINCYVIKGNERNLLIDTGFNNQICYEALTAGLKELDIDMERTDIFITHFHWDHSGLASVIASDKSKIFISEIDKNILIGLVDSRNSVKKANALGFPDGEKNIKKISDSDVMYMPLKPVNYTLLKDGDVIALGNYKLECIITPGHSPGHLCLYEKKQEILFSGDHIIFDITPNITSWLENEDSLGAYLKSLEKIREMPVKYTFSAHRSAIGNCYSRINELIEHHEERLEEVLEIVNRLKITTAYDTATKMAWSVKADNWNAFPPIQKVFAVGEASAHLEHLFFKGMLRRELTNEQYHYSL
ncbi:MBL fold metallo-hydrolase [Acetobacterium bakii]|uniref:Metallo-beta-lactamase domain-containing protein n=1 Tax=Acetobacterium bakii TaxID=52689 RepID=A0A0L6TZD6_9FIRM|nr:MBL fold metallo-hydrolase [Acetobacterium bakii]KNZ41613.1 hypothetical protein AKG39_11565 [Acetobacterium bakii]